MPIFATDYYPKGPFTHHNRLNLLTKIHFQYGQDFHATRLPLGTVPDCPAGISFVRAVLEYLLLRPRDTVFFDGPRANYWRFIVIDEAHTYSGAKGIEIAMLLRRLKDRVAESHRAKLQCVATSATLGQGRDDFPMIVRFAQQLFGEDFEWYPEDPGRQDVVEATRLPLAGGDRGWGRPEPWVYREWEQIIDRNLSREQAVLAMRVGGARAGIPADILDRGTGAGWPEFLYEVLQGDTNLLNLQRELQDRPRLLAELPPALGLDSEDATAVVASLVNLANQARMGDSTPLLPARYHLFVRAIEGAYLSLLPGKKLFLERHEKISEQGSDYQVFETATCRQCGAAYLVGQRKQENGHEILNMPGERGKMEYFLLLDQEANTGDPDEDEEVEFPEGKGKEDKYKRHLLCLRCGTIDQENILQFPCQCGQDSRVPVLHVPSREDRISVCPSCGKHSSGGVTRRFLVGADASATVLGSALYQEITPGKKAVGNGRPRVESDDPWATEAAAGTEIEEEETGAARKLLVFSDSRQDAAFFAPYLSRTYNQIVHRNLIIQTLRDNSDLARTNVWRLQDLIAPLRHTAESHSFFTDNESPQERINEVWKWVLHEFLSPDQKISLEGLGLLGFSLVEPSHWAPPPPLLGGKWGLSRPEVLSLLQVLLHSLRTKAVVKFPDQVSPQDDFFKPRNWEHFVRGNTAVPGRGIFSWNSTKTNGRLDYLLRLAAALGTGITPEECREALKKIWASVLMPEGRGPWAEYFIAQKTRHDGVVYQLRHNFWRIHSPLVDGQVGWFICDKCQNLTLHNLRGVCPSYRCTGRLHPCDPQQVFQANHYRQQYLSTLPIRMRAEEHTAQLTSAAASQLQNTFLAGGVNILSCSTTFELGVDVGELEAVFMKNMPPSAANYIQRAGRAGRRTESNAFALTYAQRRSHDLDHFREPWRMVAGKISAPYFALENEKIVLRHIYATALAAFWREYRDLFGTVENFFFATEAYGPQLLQSYLAQRSQELKESLLRIVPPSLHRELDLAGWGWVDRLFEGDNGIMLTAAAEIVTDVKELNQLKQEAFSQNKPVEHLRRLIKTLMEKDIIGFLSNHNIIPKYGFPVDVVELQIMHHGNEAKRLQLERDLRIALAEYAPSSQVVAGGKLWTSRYIKRLPDREWESFRYTICDECQSYTRERAEFAEKIDICSVCGTRVGKNQGVFIVPSFGFIAAQEEPGSPGEEKPERTYSTRVYFSGDSADERNMRLNLGQGLALELTAASQGKLAIINNAGFCGFQVCRFCGFTVLGDESAPSSHKTHWGKDCPGKLQKHLSLGHEFATDIVKLYFAGYQDLRKGFWTSLLYALIEGASSALQIERQDVDGCLYPTPGNPVGSPTLILFDDVPGGAGHVRRLANEDDLRKVLKVSLERLNRCECGGPDGDASCYGCLRHYRNQYCHGELRRGMVIDFLSQKR